MGKDAFETSTVDATPEHPKDSHPKESQGKEVQQRSKSFRRNAGRRKRGNRRSKSDNLETHLLTGDSASEPNQLAIEPDQTTTEPAEVASLQEAALHQRAKALGLPDSLEPHTPLPQEASGLPATLEPDTPLPQQASSLPLQEETNLPSHASTETPLQEPTLPVQESTPVLQELQEAAIHQRAKVLGAPDESHIEPIASTPQTIEREVVASQSEVVAQQPHILEAENDAVALPSNEDPSALDSQVVSLHITEGKPETFVEKIGEKVQAFKAVVAERRNSLGESAHNAKLKIIERRNSLEEAGHNARLKVDAALEKKWGAQAEKIQTEIENARLSAINDTARIAELLQVQFSHCASDLRDQQQEIMLTADPLLEQKEVPLQAEALPLESTSEIHPENADNIVAQRALEAQQGMEETARLARSKIDGALERNFGSQAEKVQFHAEKAKEHAIDDIARAAELVQAQLGKSASSLREQLQQGAAPNYH